MTTDQPLPGLCAPDGRGGLRGEPLTRRDLALEHGACPRCTTNARQVWHYSGCDRWAAAPERERAVQCATIGCPHTSFRNDRLCVDCVLAATRLRVGANGGRVPPPAPTPSALAAPPQQVTASTRPVRARDGSNGESPSLTGSGLRVAPSPL